jgi:hypothetical protein
MNMYEKYKKSEYWSILEQSLLDLEKNKDIVFNTNKKYIIWYIIKNIENEK